MSKKKLPDYRLKQKILYIDKTPPETLARYGDLYLEENIPSDALDFYLKARHTAGLQKIQESALQSGDAFLFQRAAKALNTDPGSMEWEAVGRRALENHKFCFAQYALEKSKNKELIDRLAQTMKAEAAEKHP